MELKQIEALQMIAEEGSFRATAERLHRSAGSITADLGSLEREIGVKLLDRELRRITVTKAGEAFLDSTRTVPSIIDRAVRAAQFADSSGLRRVRIGHNGIAGVGLLHRVLRALGAGEPLIQVGLLEGPSTELLAQLSSGTLDLALVIPPVNSPEISHEPLLDEHLTLVVPDGHPLTTLQQVVWPDLRTETFVSPPPESSSALLLCLREMCQEYGGFEPLLSQEATSVTGLLLLVASGAGVSVLPRHYASFYRANGTRSVALSDPPASLAVHLARRRGTQTPVVNTVRQAVLKVAGDRRRHARRQVADRRRTAEGAKPPFGETN